MIQIDKSMNKYIDEYRKTLDKQFEPVFANNIIVVDNDYMARCFYDAPQFSASYALDISSSYSRRWNRKDYLLFGKGMRRETEEFRIRTYTFYIRNDLEQHFRPATTAEFFDALTLLPRVYRNFPNMLNKVR